MSRVNYISKYRRRFNGKFGNTSSFCNQSRSWRTKESYSVL